MSSLSQFNKLKLFNVVDKENLSTVHGYTQYAISQYIASETTTSGSSSAGTKVVPYDAFTVAAPPDVYPLQQDTGRNMSARYARHVWDNWDTVYDKCKVQLICETGDEYEAGPFATKDALYVWLNTVVPNDGVDITHTSLLRVYDEIAGDVPVIQKMYGVNTLYSNLVGARNTRSSAIKTASAGPYMWLDVFEDLTEYYVNSGDISSVVTRADLEADNLNYTGEGIGSNKLFWVGANKRNLYGLPKENSTVELNVSVPPDYRKFWNITTTSSVDQSTSDAGSYTLLSPCYMAYVESTKSWEIKDPSSPTDVKYFYDYSEDIPTVIIYLIKHRNDANKFAFYVKPVGINTIYVDYYDATKYRLEAVGFNKDRQVRIKNVPIIDQDLYGDRTRVEKPGWIISDNNSKTSNVGAVLPKSIKFRLRRLSDNKVGGYSLGTIKPVVRTRGAYVKWLVT